MITNCGNTTCRPITPVESGVMPGGSVLSCGCGSAGPLPTIDQTIANIFNPYPVASASIDLRAMKCPCILISFTGIINIPAGAEPTINFNVVKSSCGQSVQIASYTFNTNDEEAQSTSFAFQCCDSSQCGQQCPTYTVEIANATTGTDGVIVNGNISVLAVEKICY